MRTLQRKKRTKPKRPRRKELFWSSRNVFFLAEIFGLLIFIVLRLSYQKLCPRTGCQPTATKQMGKSLTWALNDPCFVHQANICVGSNSLFTVDSSKMRAKNNPKEKASLRGNLVVLRYQNWRFCDHFCSIEVFRAKQAIGRLRRAVTNQTNKQPRWYPGGIMLPKKRAFAA